MKQFFLNIKHEQTWLGRVTCQLLMVCCCLLLPSLASAAEGTQVRKLNAGLELFPSFLAADQQIKSKQDKQGELQLVILYKNDRRTAEKMAMRLNQIGTIKSIPIHTTVLQAQNFIPPTHKPAGIFISQENITNISQIVQYGKDNSIVTFSPFASDLQEGVTGSISIAARIRPEVNMGTLKSSKLMIKPFFLRISKQYSR